MSVSAQATKTIVAGDGRTTAFTFQFALPAGSSGSDVLVFVVDNEGNVTLLTSNYSVNVLTSQVVYPVATPDPGPLGSTYSAVPAGWQLVMARVEALTQNLQLSNQGLFSLPAIEAALDYLMMCIQQLQEQLNRCVMLPINTPNTTSGPVVVPSTTVLPFYNGTWAQIQILAAANPTQVANGFASDLNGGQGAYCFYTANTSVGNNGWVFPSVGVMG